MPPVKRIKRSDIINSVLNILMTEEIDSINARRIAKELNCSVQPIFYNFKNMDELKSEVINEIYNIYKEYMIKGSKEEKSYKGMGRAYINFAIDYPNYFKLLFMSNTHMTTEDFILNDNVGNTILKTGMEYTGFSYDKQKKFHLKVWIFTHGLATLIQNKTLKLSDDEIDKILRESVYDMLVGERNSENE